MKHTPNALAGTLLSAVLLLAACGSSADTPSADSGTPSADSTTAVSDPPAASEATVGIDNFEYDPEPITVAVGTTITWTNDQDFDHTVSAGDGSFDSGDMSTGDTFEHTFDAAGTFAYVCSIHPNMIGTVIVQ